ncbi:transcriptional regulator [Candidatus Scalindua japonica]|uniref:Transcriptional regulator n=1 Tax=Candidatus Scalindua japonica TaxID=1284222 RepID=A0A286TX61_9BACT|nr:winged helix-turn-helix transcriptional regulator [Candidatus Scalindua japonica]GAX60475.1 transcriptional regulator [Candidatus Scalindua japonica]
MKLTKNEIRVLKLLVENPLAINSDVSKKLKITSQAVGKIRKQLYEKGVIKNHELRLNYNKLDINILSIALIKILPSVFKIFKNNELDKVVRPVNAIRSYAIRETDVTHIIIYAFRDIEEYDTYFKDILDEFSDYVEIKHSFVLSSKSVLKSSSMDMLLKVLGEYRMNNK